MFLRQNSMILRMEPRTSSWLSRISSMFAQSRFGSQLLNQITSLRSVGKNIVL